MKKWLGLLTALLLMLVASACGTATPMAQPPASTEEIAAAEANGTDEPVVVTFAVSGDAAEKAAYETLVAAFEDAYPEIDIELSHIPSAGDYEEKLVADYAAGIPPDIALLNHRTIGPFAVENQFEPLGPYLDDSDLVEPEDYYPVALDAFRWQGEVMCIPQNASSLVVYYNKDLFDAAGLDYPVAGWTWDDFVETAKALTLDNDGDGVMDQYGLGFSLSFFRVVPFLASNQVQVVDNLDAPTQLTMTRRDAQEVLQWFVDLRQVHGVIPDRAEEESASSESRFIDGTTAMFLNSRRGTPTYREITAFEWDVAPLPEKEVPASVLHSDGYCMAAATENKEAAWTFIEFANSVQGQQIIATTGRTVPSLIEVAESEYFLEPDKSPANSQVFLDNLEYVVRVPTISTWDEIEGTATEEFERALFGDVSVVEAANAMVLRTEEYFLLARTQMGY